MIVRACLAAVLIFTPAAMLAAQNAQTGSGAPIGVMTIRGKAGIATQVSPSQISLEVPEHVTFTVHILPGTRFTQDGQQVSAGAVQPGSAIFVHGLLDIQARTLNAQSIDVLTQSRPLRMVIENYGRTWTAGVITAVGNGSITIQHMDGSLGELVVNTNTSVLFHGQPARRSALRKGERVNVRLERNDPSVAESIRIQGMDSGS
jgi:hypothetical protein